MVFVMGCAADEPLHSLSMGQNHDYRKILFTDQKDLQIDGVEVRYIDEKYFPSSYASRIPKIRPHKFIPDTEWAIYIDNNAILNTHPDELVQASLDFSANDNYYVGVSNFRHPMRKCIFRELKYCYDHGLINEIEFHRIRSRLYAIGMRKNKGMPINTLLVHDLRDERYDQFREKWWDNFLFSCKRDQISFPITYFITTRKNLAFLPGDFMDYAHRPVFDDSIRDRSTYLAI